MKLVLHLICRLLVLESPASSVISQVRACLLSDLTMTNDEISGATQSREARHYEDVV